MKATVFDIQLNSFVDGPGIRTTVFFKGCNLRCKWCHNPESQKMAPQMLLYQNKCTGCGKCAQVCPNRLQNCDLCGKCTIFCPNDARSVCGKEMSVEELLREVEKDRAFYETSGGGVTCSGGECMLQIDALVEFLAGSKNSGLHTAVDTAGNVPWESFARILPVTDLFLYDVKCISEKLHREGTGVSNRLILENLCRLAKEFSGEILVRVPVIGGFNADLAEMTRIAEFLKEIGLTRVELLPYHSMGEHKYPACGMEKIAFTVPSEEEMAAFRKVFL